MKKINGIMAGVCIFWLLLLLTAEFLWSRQENEAGRAYLVEVNRMMRGMEEKQGFSMPDLQEEGQIREVSFLPYEKLGDAGAAADFLRHHNGSSIHIEPLMADQTVLGLVRFDYGSLPKNKEFLRIMEGLLTAVVLFVLTILVYIRNRILKPFAALSSLPYDLAKGHIQMEIEENRNRFFGKFIWGISMLRDHLQASRKKTLQLEREKKMLLLSVSHDIKTPLNSIKLYARALEEDLYDSREEKRHAVMQIRRLSEEIEEFVKKIVQTSSEEIVPIEVENAEFYLEDLVSMIKEYYVPRCRLLMIKFTVAPFENKLISGDMDRAFEAVENIMENAIKYGDGKSVDITVTEEEDCQLIRIKNSGNPVKTEELPHLFDSFYRGSNAGTQEGNGLGLYICREIMLKMHGEIFAQPEEDGMCFVLVFST